MAGKRVAPTLVALVETAAKDYGVEGRCRAELRALLAVERAADRFFWHSVQNDPCCFTDSCGEGARFRRAKARLDAALLAKPAPSPSPRQLAEKILAEVKAHGMDMTTERLESMLREAVVLLKATPPEDKCPVCGTELGVPGGPGFVGASRPCDACAPRPGDTKEGK